MKRIAVLLAALTAPACGDGTGPTDVPFGVTTFVVQVNPVVNDANQATVPTPGTTQSSVSVSVAGGPSGTTDAAGVVVLTDIDAGSETISASGGGASGQLTVSIADRDLRELAVALSGNTTSLIGQRAVRLWR